MSPVNTNLVAQQQKTGHLSFSLDLENNLLNVQDGPTGYALNWTDIQSYVAGTESIRTTEVLVQVIETLIAKSTNLTDPVAVATDLNQNVFKLLN